MNIVECMDDPVLFEPWFKGSSWDAWRAVLKGAYALPLSESEFAQFHQLTERAPPKKPARELWAICGRRSGKDSIASLIAAFRAAFFDAKASKLRRGERATVMCLATDREQARIVLGYIRAYFNDIPLLKSMVRAETSNGLALKNGVDIVISTSDYRSVRGRAVALAIFDEAAFWPSDGSASPDTAVYDAVRPGTLTVRGSIIGISTPYRKSGLLYERWKEHYGKDDSDVLVVKAPSLALNPTLDPIEIAAELQRDPEKAKAEWLAEWRSDISKAPSISALSIQVVAQPTASRWPLLIVSRTARLCWISSTSGARRLAPMKWRARWRRYCGNIASARFKATITAPASWSASLPNAVSSISTATATAARSMPI
jgi:hypothetical protein